MPKKSSAGKGKNGSSSMKHGKRSQGESQGKSTGSGTVKSSWNKIPGASMTGGGKSKAGCLPKFSILFLPFLAAGIYFLLRS